MQPVRGFIMSKINHSIIFWDTYLDKDRQIEISEWYNNLSKHDKEIVNDIRQEAIDESNWEETDIGYGDY
jgi:hypothetical protein